MREDERVAWERLVAIGVVSGDMPVTSWWDLNGLDFHGEDLSGLHLAGCRFEDANLQDVNLEGAFLNIAKFRRANFRKANLRYASIWNADLSQCDLSHANLEGANVSASRFNGADLTCANLTRCDMRESVFAGANLRAASAQDADMYGACFTGSNLTDACFNGADVTFIMLDNAKTDGLTLDGCRPKEKYIVPGCHMCGRGDTPKWYHYEDDLQGMGLKLGDPIKRCLYCGATIRYGDLRVEIVGTNGSEVGKVIDKVRKMQKQEPPRPRFEYDIFLSYSSNDEKTASQVYDMLVAQGLVCFFAPVSISGGTLWEDELQQAANSSRLGVVLLTRESLSSKWVLLELGAFWAAKKPLIVATADSSVRDLPQAIGKFQAVDITSTRGLEQLCDAATKLCSKDRKKPWWRFRRGVT